MQLVAQSKKKYQEEFNFKNGFLSEPKVKLNFFSLFFIIHQFIAKNTIQYRYICHPNA